MGYLMTWALPTMVAIGALALMVWQDGIHECNDGRRYTSGTPQPTPFHRRWCGWPRRLLIACTYVGLVFVASTLGSWWQALIFSTLPGVWFCATRPTTVDAPAMALAWASALMMPRSPYVATLLACLSGLIHERGPVFAALYAWHPLPLIGLVSIGWWRKPAPRDNDPFVGLSSIRDVIRVHKRMQDWLSWKAWVFPSRALVPMAALASVPLSAWFAFALASATRIVGTDNSRYILWGAPPMIAALHDTPLWLVAVHAMSFLRVV